MSNALAKKDIYLDLSIDDDGFDFATSIDDALAQAEAELVVLNETVESIKELKPQCDKLDYILAASSGALCGVFVGCHFNTSFQLFGVVVDLVFGHLLWSYYIP